MPKDFALEAAHIKSIEAAGFDLEKIASGHSIIYVLCPDLNVVYCNDAWDVFALENGGAKISRSAVLGTSILDSVPSALKLFYQEGFQKALKSAEPWDHEYECSSPDLFRLFHMRVLPLANGYLIVEHSLQVERVHGPERKPLKAVLPLYLEKGSTLTMCSHCRRARRVNRESKQVWDWVPAFVRQPPARVEHGLCGSCQVYYYGTA